METLKRIELEEKENRLASDWEEYALIRDMVAELALAMPKDKPAIFHRIKKHGAEFDISGRDCIYIFSETEEGANELINSLN